MNHVILDCSMFPQLYMNKWHQQRSRGRFSWSYLGVHRLYCDLLLASFAFYLSWTIRRTDPVILFRSLPSLQWFITSFIRITFLFVFHLSRKMIRRTPRSWFISWFVRLLEITLFPLISLEHFWAIQLCLEHLYWIYVLRIYLLFVMNNLSGTHLIQQ